MNQAGEGNEKSKAQVTIQSPDNRDRDLFFLLRGLYARVRQWKLANKMRKVRFTGLAQRQPDAPTAEVQPKSQFPCVDPSLGPGVNLYGYMRAEFGLGQSARRYASALLRAGYPVALNDANIEIPHASGDRSLAGLVGDQAPYPVNLVFVNPDHFVELLPRLRRDTYTIGFWFWELDTVPEAWKEALSCVDEVWVSTEFVAQAFRRATGKPVVRIPHPVDVERTQGLHRACFDLDENAFVFLCSFDFNSSIHRKNPYAVVDAFKLAFPDRGRAVQLLIKTSNGHRHLEALELLREHAEDDSRILIRDQILQNFTVTALQKAADAYVSLHRAEGLGLGMAESMALGKAVIGTAWSGNLDFMTEENSCLVPYRLIPVQDQQYLHAREARWAQADVQAAANWMVRLAGSAELVRKKGQAAQRDVMASMNQQTAAAAMIARLRHLELQ